MSAVGPALGLVGVGLSLWGASEKAADAKRRQQVLKDLMATPDVDIGALDQAVLGRQEAAQSRVTALARQYGLGAAETAKQAQEIAQPGSAERVKSFGSAIDQIISGKAGGNPWSIFGEGAADTLARGFGGTGAGAINTYNLGRRTRMAELAHVPSLLAALGGYAPHYSTPTGESFMPLSTQGNLSAILQQRQQRFALGSQLSQTEGPGGVWGGALEGLGGTMMGAGLFAGMSNMGAGPGQMAQNMAAFNGQSLPSNFGSLSSINQWKYLGMLNRAGPSGGYE